jgi:hypothetical protein
MDGSVAKHCHFGCLAHASATCPPQALFRPVAMMVPDYRLIAEVSLYANGFQNAALLAINLVSVLKVCDWHLGSHLLCGCVLPVIRWMAS